MNSVLMFFYDIVSIVQNTGGAENAQGFEVPFLNLVKVEPLGSILDKYFFLQKFQIAVANQGKPFFANYGLLEFVSGVDDVQK